MVKGVVSLETLITLGAMLAVLGLFVTQYVNLERLGVQGILHLREKYACMLLSSVLRNSEGLKMKVVLPYKVSISCPLKVNGRECNEWCSGGGEGDCFVVSNHSINPCSS